MKKIVSIMLALVLVFSLAACGSDKGRGETKSAETKATEATTAPETKATESEIKEETKASEAETKEETKSTDAETSESAQSGESTGETEAPFAGIGTWDGNTYTSEELGLTFEMPEGWQMALEGSVINETTTMEFTIMDSATQENVILMTEDLTASGMADTLTEEDYLDILKAQISQKEGFTVEDGISEQQLGNDTYKVMAATGSQNGVNFRQLYLVHKIDSKMYSFFVTAMEETGDSIDTFFKSFKSVN